MMRNTAWVHSNGRRQFLRTALSGVVAGVAAQAGIDFVAPARLNALATLTPETALQDLLDGNQRFAANQLTSIQHDLIILKEKTVDKQEPFAAVLACADSRVPVELLFDQTIGHIFVTRVAGNIATPEIIASLEYAVVVLGVQALLVLGHSNCGAVKAAMTTENVPGQISALYSRLRLAVDLSRDSLDKAIAANAKVQADLLRTSSTVILNAVKEDKLKVAAAVYNLGTGRVTLV